jgi:hypothetical protein
MTPEEREQMRYLCDRIAVEKSRDEFSKLMDDLLELIHRKEKRLEKDEGNPPTPNSN